MARSAMSLAPPPPRVTPARWMLTATVPSAPATTLSMSPAWCVAEPARPCALPVGLKCPPALLASAALQSPFSCTWMPCTLLGWRPPMVPARCTPSPIGMSSMRPLTKLPDAAARLACACDAVLCDAAGSAGFGAGGVLEQPATSVVARTAKAILCMSSLSMDLLLASGPLAAGSELAGERVTPESKPRRGLAPVSVGMLERGVEQDAIELLARFAVKIGHVLRQARPRPTAECDFPILALPRALARAHERRIELCRTDGVARGERGHAPAQVLQFAHVAGPVVALEAFERGLAEPLRRRVELAGGGGEEAFGECGHVVPAIAQRRQLQAHDVEAMQQVRAELAFGDEAFEVLVGGGDDAHVHADQFAAADAEELALRQHAQQARLQRRGHVADFVEEQGAAIGLFEAAHVALLGTGEGARLVAEQLAFEQLGGNRGGVERDERAMRARRLTVQRR